MDISNEELFEKYHKEQDSKLFDLIIEKNLYIAEILSKKFGNSNIEYDDIYQVASLGLIKAAKRFDYSKGIKFTSFATPTIIGEIKRYFRDKGNSIRIPRRIYETSQKIKAARRELSVKLGHEPNTSEISEYLDISEEAVLEAMEAGSASFQSLDQTVSSENETLIQELLGKEDAYFEKIENKDYLRKSISNLSDLEKLFINNRYFKRMTQKQIADEIGVSQMYISRLEKKVLNKLRQNIQ